MYLADAAPAGHALIDRRLYLPKAWCEDPARCQAAGVPDGVEFATKPALAAQMITVVVAVVAADEVYGADPGLRHCLHEMGVGSTG